MAKTETYLTLQQNIADELGDRQDLLSPLSDRPLASSPIKNAIQAAIAKWEREPFYFNEIYSADLFSTVTGQELYTTSGGGSNLLGTSPDLLRLHIKISGNRYPITLRSWQYLEDTSANPTVTGQPFDYAYLATTMRLYPIPDGVYPITISGTQRFAPLVSPGDANAWTKDAFDLIRAEAKLYLAREILFDDEMAGRMELAIYGRPPARGYLTAPKAETARRGSSRIRATYF